MIKQFNKSISQETKIVIVYLCSPFYRTGFLILFYQHKNTGGDIMHKTLYGSYSDNCCAYCKHHNCYLTVKQVKQHDCLKKQCWYFFKNIDHPWWKQRDVIKEKKKRKKQALYS